MGNDNFSVQLSPFKSQFTISWILFFEFRPIKYDVWAQLKWNIFGTCESCNDTAMSTNGDFVISSTEDSQREL